MQGGGGREEIEDGAGFAIAIVTKPCIQFLLKGKFKVVNLFLGLR